MFIAAAAVQAMFLHDLIGLAGFDTVLGTVFRARSAADTLVGYLVTFLLYPAVSDNIVLPEDRMNSQIEIFNFHITNRKNNPDLSCIIWVYIGKVRLLLKNHIYPFFLIRPGTGIAFADTRIISL